MNFNIKLVAFEIAALSSLMVVGNGGCSNAQPQKVQTTPADELMLKVQNLNGLVGVHCKENMAEGRDMRKAFHFNWKPKYVTYTINHVAECPESAEVRITCVGNSGMYWSNDLRPRRIPAAAYMPDYAVPTMYDEKSGAELSVAKYELRLTYEYVDKVWRLRRFTHKREGENTELLIEIEDYPRLKEANGLPEPPPLSPPTTTTSALTSPG